MFKKAIRNLHRATKTIGCISIKHILLHYELCLVVIYELLGVIEGILDQDLIASIPLVKVVRTLVQTA